MCCCFWYLNSSDILFDIVVFYMDLSWTFFDTGDDIFDLKCLIFGDPVILKICVIECLIMGDNILYCVKCSELVCIHLIKLHNMFHIIRNVLNSRVIECLIFVVIVFYITWNEVDFCVENVEYLVTPKGTVTDDYFYMNTIRSHQCDIWYINWCQIRIVFIAVLVIYFIVQLVLKDVRLYMLPHASCVFVLLKYSNNSKYLLYNRELPQSGQCRTNH